MGPFDPAIWEPLLEGERWVVGQLGQSLDGRIATASGHSHYVNGPEDIERLHHLRGLADAVIVGAGTVASDDCRLTVRRAEGTNPVRVILDPSARLPADRAVFRDGAAPTIALRRTGVPQPDRGNAVEEVTVEPGADGELPAPVIVELLESRGWRRILVEGGGRTVSHFLEAGQLDRLHICVAPLLIGSGRPGITLPEIERLDEARRPAVRHFTLGRDLLFDLDLRAAL